MAMTPTPRMVWVRVAVGATVAVAAAASAGEAVFSGGPRAPVAGNAVAAAVPRDVELLDTMTGGHRRPGGSVRLAGQERLTTAAAYGPPVSFHVSAMTDGTNIRLAYAADQIIFNWEVNPDELRIDGGPADNRDRGNRLGRVPAHKWVDIGLRVEPHAMVITVDGLERYRTTADFSAVREPLSVFPAEGSTVRVRSVRVRQE